MTVSEREVVQKALDLRVKLLESLGKYEEAEEVRQYVPLPTLPGPEDEPSSDDALTGETE